MNRINLGIFILLVFILTFSALRFTRDLNLPNSCKVGSECSKPGCCAKITKVCAENCLKSCCKKT